MTEELKRCPFCGGTANIAKGQIEFWAYCPHCGVQTELYETEREVVDAWNARQIEDKKDKEIKRLREALEVILDEAQKDEPCILAIKVVAYTALKGC